MYYIIQRIKMQSDFLMENLHHELSSLNYGSTELILVYFDVIVSKILGLNKIVQ